MAGRSIHKYTAVIAPKFSGAVARVQSPDWITCVSDGLSAQNFGTIIHISRRGSVNGVGDALLVQAGGRVLPASSEGRDVR